MPAKDIYHQAVKNALSKQGWTITDDPLFIRIGTAEMYIDLGAEKIVLAEKEGDKIAVEVKSFLSTSPVHEFQAALGRFLIYQLALEQKQPQRTLYLAVPLATYEESLSLPFLQSVIQRYQVKLIIFHPQQEVISQWLT